MRVLVLILMIGFPLLSSAAEVYKWRDKDGNIHYSDVEPAKQNTQRRVVKPKTTKALTPAELAAKDKADKDAARKALCDESKKNVATISDPANAGKLSMDLNNDGTPEILTPAQTAAQAERMKAVATINCTQ